MNDLSDLTVIVPIGDLGEKSMNLKSWLRESLTSRVEVKLVLSSRFSETHQEIENFVKENNHPKNWVIISGDFDNPGSSRNAGLNEVSTQWVAFWDADDMPILENIQKILSLGEDLNAEVLIGSYHIVNFATGRRNSIIFEDKQGHNIEKIGLNPGIWRFIFRFETIKNLTFPALKMGEDQVFLADSKFWERKVLFSSDCIYTYFYNQINQLTNRKIAVNELFFSAQILIEKLQFERNLFLKIVCERILFTALKKSNHKIATLKLVLRLIQIIGFKDFLTQALFIERNRKIYV